MISSGKKSLDDFYCEMYISTDCFSSTECNNDFSPIKTTCEKLGKARFKQARPNEKLFRKKKS